MRDEKLNYDEGLREGLRQGRDALTAIAVRRVRRLVDETGAKIAQTIGSIDDLDVLQELIDAAIDAKDLAEYERRVKQGVKRFNERRERAQEVPNVPTQSADAFLSGERVGESRQPAEPLAPETEDPKVESEKNVESKQRVESKSEPSKKPTQEVAPSKAKCRAKKPKDASVEAIPNSPSLFEARPAASAGKTPTDWNNFRFIDLFAGIGGIRLGFESVGGRCVFSSEFDEDVCQTYELNFHEHPAGDITQIDANSIPDFDMLLAGFPCQAFSIIGKKEGFANETCGTLFFEIERILKERRPPAFMLENVKNLMAHDGGRTFQTIEAHLQALGYTVRAKVLNALDFGTPQKRERIYIVGFLENLPFEFPEPIPVEERKTLADILETDVDKRYFVNPKIRDSRLARLKDPDYPRPYISHENINRSVSPRPYSAALRAGASANYILINDERRPTEREMLRLQGFPEEFKTNLPYVKVKKQCGNSVAVPVVKAVASAMMKALRREG